MSEIPIPAGLTNKEIIDLAYTGLGLSDSMFGRTQEEYATGITMLRALCGTYPFDQLGFDDAVSRVAEESGIDRKYLLAVGFSLSELLGASIGKPLQPAFAAVKARAFGQLCAEVAVIPEIEFAPGTITGAGEKRGETFFPEAT